MTSQKLWLAFLASCVVFQIASLTAVAQINVMPEDFSPNAQRALGSNADLLGQEVLTQGEPSFDHVVGALVREQLLLLGGERHARRLLADRDVDDAARQ